MEKILITAVPIHQVDVEDLLQEIVKTYGNHFKTIVIEQE
jgi:hypothetical protein